MSNNMISVDMLPTMTAEEMSDHMCDDYFFRVYGNPAVVRDNGKLKCVIMSVEFARRVEGLSEIIEELENAEKTLDEQATKKLVSLHH